MAICYDAPYATLASGPATTGAIAAGRIGAPSTGAVQCSVCRDHPAKPLLCREIRPRQLPASDVAGAARGAAFYVQRRTRHGRSRWRFCGEPDISALALRALSPNIRHAWPAAGRARHGGRLAMVDRLLAV